jgi:iron complex outermembrane receptor protein
MYFNAAFNKKVNSFCKLQNLIGERLNLCHICNFFLEIIQIMQVDMTDMFPTFEGDLKDYNATIGFKSV